MRARIGLDGSRCAAVRIPLTQNRIHGAALHFVIAGLGVCFRITGRRIRIIGNRVSFFLQFLDGRLHLGNGGTDVRQLDDVRGRVLGQLTQVGQLVIDPLLIGQAFRKLGQYPPGEGDVPQLHIDARGGREGLDNGQE